MTGTKILKRQKLRNAEYYDMQPIFDGLYENSKNNCIFTNLTDLIKREENIKLAYRNLKRNSGSRTPGTDHKTIDDLAQMKESDLVSLVQRKLDWYQPQSVRRVEIPKDNGKTRPLGIPTITDRLIQQCVLQVLEPICEAKFRESSNGFRPNRGVENALAQAEKHIQCEKLHIVIDLDIKGFFDNVNHGKLLKQMWTLGIRDKKLISIISAMLKAEVAGIGFPERGTPQGGIISPLLSNIVLNELDWWIASQWETMPTRHEYSGRIHPSGDKDKSKKYRALRTTKLKECYIVRYADDFKIFCRKYSDAVILFEATKKWLKERLGLDISPEKSKIVNLKHNYSDFLGFQLKVHKRHGKYVIYSHISPKAQRKIHQKAKMKVAAIQRSGDEAMEYEAVNDYNSFVMGIHSYYRMATCACADMQPIAFHVKKAIKNRLQHRVRREKQHASVPRYTLHYAASRELRFIGKTVLLPLGYIQHHPPLHRKRAINKYTEEGRKQIHKLLQNVDVSVVHALMRNPIKGASVEYNDNRISHYVGQAGKCAVTQQFLFPEQVNCHHLKPISMGGDDRYTNLVIVNDTIHRLIHATKEETICLLLSQVQLDRKQFEKLNKYRVLAGNTAIDVTSMNHS